ncbi:MAG TPA: aldo/keto reductase [Alphaproteobacteria bacterium]|nr:aldo/keto reductase [Alphaproteobacteria bacterium]
MKHKVLGRTGLLVSRLCLGTNTFGGKGNPYWEPLGALDQKAATEMVGRAFEAGINFFDTANIYAAGESEERLGCAIREAGIPRANVVIATKAGMKMGTDVNGVGASRGHLMSAVEASLKRLGTDYVDVFMIHQWDRLTPMEETMRALGDLVRGGKVRHLGCSNFAAWQIMLANGIAERERLSRFEVTEAYYSIATRDIEREQVPMLLHQNVGLTIWGALLGGVLTGKYKRGGALPAGTRFSGGIWMPFDTERTFDIVDAMQAIARARDIPVARIAIAWLLHQPVVTSVIFGARTLAQLDENLAAIDVALTTDELQTLDAVSALPPEYPTWKIAEAYRDRPDP